MEVDSEREIERVEQLCEALMQRVANGKEQQELQHAFLNYDMGRTPFSASEVDNRNDMFWVKSHAMMNAVTRSKARMLARTAKSAAQTDSTADSGDDGGSGESKDGAREHVAGTGRIVKARGGGNWWGMMGRERAATLSAKELLSALQNMLARRIAQGRSKDNCPGKSVRIRRSNASSDTNHPVKCKAKAGARQLMDNNIDTRTVALSDAELLARYCINDPAHKASFGAAGCTGTAESQIDVIELVAGIVRIGTTVRDKKKQDVLEERLGRQRRTGLRARARAQRVQAAQQAGAATMSGAGTSSHTNVGHCFAWRSQEHPTPLRSAGTAAFVVAAHAGDAHAAQQQQREERIRAAFLPYVSLTAEASEGQPPLANEARARRALGNAHGVLRFEPFLCALRNLLGAWDAKLLTGTLEHVTLADIKHVNEERARALFNRLDKDRSGAIALDTAVGALAKLGANEQNAPQKRSLLGAGSAAKPALDRFGGGPCAVAHRHLR